MSSTQAGGLVQRRWRRASEPAVVASPTANTTRPCTWCRTAVCDPWTPNVRRRFAAVFAIVVETSATKFAACAPRGPRRPRNSNAVREGAQDTDAQEPQEPPVRRPHEPGHALQVAHRGRNDVDASVGVVDPVDGHLVDPQAASLRQHQQLGVEEPSGVFDLGDQRRRHITTDRLEPALRIGEVSAERRVEDEVVATGDDLAVRAPHHARVAWREPAADRDVGVPADEWRDQRQQRGEVGRQVDVHVGEDCRVRRRPRGPQRPSPSLLLEPDEAHVRGSSSASCIATRGVASALALSAIVMRKGYGNDRVRYRCNLRTDHSRSRALR